MENLFVTYAIALLLKQLGFNEKCLAYFNDKKTFYLHDHPNAFYTDNEHVESYCTNIFSKKINKANACQAPTWEQVETWLRDNHNIAIIWDIQSGSSCTYNPFKEGFCFEIVKGINYKTCSLPVSNNIVHDSYYTGRAYNILEVLEYLKK